jgi:predicted transcriptional regulator of viral defense system
MMKYLSELMKLKIFTYDDIIKLIGNKNSAKNILQNYLSKGYIKRIKKNLYTAISQVSLECAASKYLIASNLTSNSFVSHHSAFEFYNYYNQIYNTVSVSSKHKFNNFEFEGYNYKLIQTNSMDFVLNIRGIKVSSIERTIIDSIKDNNKYSDLEETLNCINMIPYINEEDILKYLEIINSKILYKKVGIILSLFKEKFNISESFFVKCHDISDNIKGYFDNNKQALVYNSLWKIYICKDLLNYIKKE